MKISWNRKSLVDIMSVRVTVLFERASELGIDRISSIRVALATGTVLLRMEDKRLTVEFMKRSAERKLEPGRLDNRKYNDQIPS